MKTRILGGMLAFVLAFFGVVAPVAPMFASAEELEAAAEQAEGEDAPVEEEVKEEIPEDYIQIEDEWVDFGFADEVERSYSSSFKVKNLSDKDVAIRLSTEKYAGSIAEESKKGVEWLVFVNGKNFYEIPAKDEVDVLVRFNIPKDAENGRSQYATVKVIEDGKEEGAEAKRVNLKIGVAKDGEKLQYGGEVAEISADFVKFSDQLHGYANVKNNGKVGFEARMKVRVSPAFGLEKWTDVYEDSRELGPNDTVYFSYDNQIGYGVFKVEQLVSYMNEEGKVETLKNMRRTVMLPLWSLFAVIGVVVLIIAIIVIVKVIQKKKRNAEGVEEE